MPGTPHPAVHAVHRAARSVAQHGEAPEATSRWRRWLPSRRDHLYDKVRAFGHVLEHLLDVPPAMLTAEDIAAIGADVDQVAQRAEQEIERNDRSTGEPLESFPALIYTIRERYERVYRRGSS